MGQILLCSGGVSSGKSQFAEKLSVKLGEKILYVATTKVLDEEMQEKVRLHRNRSLRANMDTWEEPVNLLEAWEEKTRNYDVILLDCLTMFIFNRMVEMEGAAYDTLREKIVSDIEKLLEIWQRQSQTVIIVSNEVGCGMVAMETMSRQYQKLVGEINQKIAMNAQHVYMTFHGITVDMKAWEV